MPITITINGKNWMLKPPSESNKKFRLHISEEFNSYDYEFKTFDEAVAFIKENLL